MKLVMVQRIGKPPIPGPYTLHMIVEDTAALDLGNTEKAVSDMLQVMGIITNDKFARRIVLEWGDIIGCEVTIQSID